MLIQGFIWERLYAGFDLLFALMEASPPIGLSRWMSVWQWVRIQDIGTPVEVMSGVIVGAIVIGIFIQL